MRFVAKSGAGRSSPDAYAGEAGRGYPIANQGSIVNAAEDGGESATGGTGGLQWEPNPKHGKGQRGNAAPEPTDPLGTLINSVPIGAKHNPSSRSGSTYWGVRCLR
jgi:hypothetical protein